MKILSGFIIISASFHIALNHLGQGVGQFWDLVAFSIVGCGTISVCIMTMPSIKFVHLLKILRNGLRSNDGLREDCIGNATNLIQGNTPTGEAKRIDQKILIDGLELLKLGFSSEKISNILTERVEKYCDDCMTIAQWIRGLAKYPPAFGLAGTVLGLVHLMHGLSDGTNPKETGMRMAIALVATFYGIIIANIFISPIGDRVMNNTIEDQNLAEISLKAVMALSERRNYLEVLEEMNSFVPSQHEKISFNYGSLEAS